jgi:hypothetical protein
MALFKEILKIEIHRVIPVKVHILTLGHSIDYKSISSTDSPILILISFFVLYDVLYFSNKLMIYIFKWEK